MVSFLIHALAFLSGLTPPGIFLSGALHPWVPSSSAKAALSPGCSPLCSRICLLGKLSAGGCCWRLYRFPGELTFSQFFLPEVVLDCVEDVLNTTS